MKINEAANEQELKAFLAKSRLELKGQSKNNLIRIVQELSLKVALLEDIVNKALEEQKEKNNDQTT